MTETQKLPDPSADLVRTTKSILLLLDRLPAWNFGKGPRSTDAPVFRTALLAPRAVGPQMTDDELRLAREAAVLDSLRQIVLALDAHVDGFREYADKNAATESELAALKRDVAAVRRVFGSETI